MSIIDPRLGRAGGGGGIGSNLGAALPLFQAGADDSTAPLAVGGGSQAGGIGNMLPMLLMLQKLMQNKGSGGAAAKQNTPSATSTGTTPAGADVLSSQPITPPVFEFGP